VFLCGKMDRVEKIDRVNLSNIGNLGNLRSLSYRILKDRPDAHSQ
jgi:hypothetical protein